MHRYEEPDKYAVHYRHPSGRFARWNNALGMVYPRKPHVHVGVEGVRERKAEDLSMGGASSIINGIKRECKKSARGNETVKRLKRKYRVSSFEEFERKILEGEISPSYPGDLGSEDDWLLWSEIEYRQKRLVPIKPETYLQ